MASVGAARAAMALQTGLDKKTVLNIRPAFLIVPAALELKAEQLVAQNLVPADSAKVVPQSIRKGLTQARAGEGTDAGTFFDGLAQTK